MRKLVLFIALVGLSTPAFADSDADFKAMVEGLVKSYVDSFNSKNADGVIATYAADGVYFSEDGRIDRINAMHKGLDGVFAMGLHIESSVTEAHRYGDAGFAIGKYVLTIPGKDFKGGGNWNAAYEITGDKVRTKLLAASVPPPKP